MALIRIHRWVSNLGLASRKEAEEWIRDGRIAINGDITTDPSFKADDQNDCLEVGGKKIDTERVPPKVYWMLHKPDLCLCARPEDSTEKNTIYDLPRLKKLKFHVFSVGRLDFRSEGLLILTNDGDLAHRLAHPKFHVPRLYAAVINKKLTSEQLAKIRSGVKLEDGFVENIKIKFADSRSLGASTGARYFVTVEEGRNRLVRRLFAHFDTRVLRLMRVGFGNLRLSEDLKPGDYRQLTGDEIHYLKKITKLL